MEILRTTINAEAQESLKFIGRCKSVMQQDNVSWVPDLIRHYQSFEHFRKETYQKWIIKRLKGKRKIVQITCLSISTKQNKPATILASLSVKDFDFPYEDLTIIYTNKVCYLNNESFIKLLFPS